MSTILCGCDAQAGHLCQRHLAEAAEEMRVEGPTPAQAFEAEAVNIAQRTVTKFKQRLAAERAMADTVAVKGDDEVRLLSKALDTANQNGVAAMYRIEKLTKDNTALVKRIEELEAQRSVYAPKAMHDAHDLITRIAYVLRTFYYAELSMSSVQPLLALCLELNPEIVEQRR
jgi:hypothetical protein